MIPAPTIPSSTRRRFVALAAIAAAGLLIRPGQGRAADPAVAPIQSFYDALLEAMKQGKELGVKGRFAKLEPVVNATFDMPTVTKVASGFAWSQTSPDEQGKLVASFKRMVTARYANQFNSYSGEKFVVQPTATARGNDRIVQSQIVPTSGDPTSLFYLMRGSGDDWKAEDVYLDGTISQLAVWRSDFSSVLQSGGAPALITKLNSLADQLMTGS
jgi:phospholipid transport system substrate-binding protein